ncbi:MAG: hypothetical protein EHM24_11865 [Acidobacteria bacterium]|nr:MAG: hypothetical protein EHM24_11865 [Acidobacteriota bacterium]
MPSMLALGRVWQIIKEVDLEAIRRQAEAPVRVAVVAETPAVADDLAVLLASGDPKASEWLTAMDAGLASRVVGAAPTDPVVDGPDVIVLVTTADHPAPAMNAVRQAWLDRRTPLLEVVLGGREVTVDRQDAQRARVALDVLGPERVAALADGLFAVVAPDRRLALARQFPALRACAFSTLIDETSKANAGYAFSTGIAEIIPVLGIPMTIGDMVVLTKNQLLMGYRIALAAGRSGQPRELIAEILGVLGGGLLFRQLARQLIGLVPVIGIVPKVAVAYGGTWAIGRAVTLWATGAGRVTGERLRQLSREGLRRGETVARDMREAGGGGR